MILMRLISIKTNKQTKQTKQQQQQNCLISNGCYLISDNFEFQHEILLRPPLNGYRTKLQSATYICFSHAQSATQYTRNGKGGKKVHFLVQRTSSAWACQFVVGTTNRSIWCTPRSLDTRFAQVVSMPLSCLETCTEIILFVGWWGMGGLTTNALLAGLNWTIVNLDTTACNWPFGRLSVGNSCWRRRLWW